MPLLFSPSQNYRYSFSDGTRADGSCSCLSQATAHSPCAVPRRPKARSAQSPHHPHMQKRSITISISLHIMAKRSIANTSTDGKAFNQHHQPTPTHGKAFNRHQPRGTWYAIARTSFFFIWKSILNATWPSTLCSFARFPRGQSCCTRRALVWPHRLLHTDP